MKKYIPMLLIVGFTTMSMAQITFNGCYPLFEDQEYTFNLVDTDATGRNVYTTTPVDGNQTCGGLGICEFTMSWNDTNSRWEFIADDGNGNFSTPFLIYFNTAMSTPNPPGLLLGTWEENDAITGGDCGGNLSNNIGSLSGDVQDTVLGIEDNQLQNLVKIHPNPVNDVINIKTSLKIEAVKLYDVSGKTILNEYDNLNFIDVSSLHSGLYFLKIEVAGKFIIKKITIH